MPMPLTLEKFHEFHPYPDQCNINSLFRFYKIDLKRVQYLENLFTDRKLYHPLPSQFNDPFECKPHFNLPKKLHKIKKHIEKAISKEGHNKEKAKAVVSEGMKDKEFLQKTISDAIQKSYAELRICSFTTQKDNLLFWSHYADSHKGFCVEFDATKMPISNAFKVQYEKEYPEAIYPMPNDATTYTPALVKSEIWKYEKEFRTIFAPWAEPQPTNDGESLILRGDEIRNVYLGSNIDENNKKLILNLVEHGAFNPGIWTTSLAKFNFRLEFDQVV